MTRRLDIAIGPVQGFVAQSRRTRDLWGSSYLLSFLSGHAMLGSRNSGGRVVQPVIESDPLFRRIAGITSNGPPRFGSLPNRFVVEVDGDANAVADAARTAFVAAWEQVCEAVWEKYMSRYCERGGDTRAIWERQVNAFWEMVWTVGSTGNGLLSSRKHWRTHWLPDEPGDKCTVMHDLQELSGQVRSTGSIARNAQDEFWTLLRNDVGKRNLRDNERLCAIAFIKRLFPLSEDALGWPMKAFHWPSTTHIAALPWISRVEESAPNLARNYAEKVTRVAPHGVLFPTSGRMAAGGFRGLDANWFHRHALEDKHPNLLQDDIEDNQRDALVEILKDIGDKKDGSGQRIGEPSSFYALLLADGDRLGELGSKIGGSNVGKALAKFTGNAPHIVRKRDGETVYAGGDDVLAMLPVHDALRTATELVEAYRTAFGGERGATLSAAVVLTHIRYPLGAAIRESHRLLNDVAKTENGRDSLAVGLVKPGGLNAQWVTSWTRPGRDNTLTCSVTLLQELVNSLDTEAGEAGLSSSVVYRIRESLTRIGGWGSWRPGVWGSVRNDARMFLRAEIGQSLSVRTGEPDNRHVGAIADLVWNLLQRAAHSDDGKVEGEARIGVDVLLLARFLAKDGEREASA